MKQVLYCLLLVLFFSACKKDTGSSKVEIYMLKSFNKSSSSTNPAYTIISNAILADTAFVDDEDIQFYDRADMSFTINKDIHSTIKTYLPDKAFAVTVDKTPVYYGLFYPGYFSSLVLGIPTMDPITTTNRLWIQFNIDASLLALHLDSRNDSRLIDALRSSGRLR